MIEIFSIMGFFVTIEIILTIVATGIITWVFSSHYHKKSSKDLNNYHKKISKNQKEILTEVIRDALGTEDSKEITKKVIEEFEKRVYDSSDPTYTKSCPRCGSKNLDKKQVEDEKNHRIYFMVNCKDCGWSDWTE